MFRIEDVQCVDTQENECPKAVRMDIRNVESVQRVVNFSLDDGRMVPGEPFGRTIPGVTMICDLPLLFANGLPTCVEHLTVGQLEKFVPYMIQCSGGALNSGAVPEWWPSEVEFVNAVSLVRPPDMCDSEWVSCLRAMVLRCYSFHGCGYALRLCVDPSHKSRAPELTLIDGLDGTMSLYNKQTRKLSACFRAANVSCFRKEHIFAKELVTKRRACSESTQKNRSLVDIYLCDNCDLEFSTLKEMEDHEHHCSRKHCFRGPSSQDSLHQSGSFLTSLTFQSRIRISKSCTHNASTRLRKQCFLPNCRRLITRNTSGHCDSSARSVHQEDALVRSSSLNGVCPRYNGTVSTSPAERQDRATCSEKNSQTVAVQTKRLSPALPLVNLSTSVNCDSFQITGTNGTFQSDNISSCKGNVVTENSRKRKKKTFHRMSLMPRKEAERKDVNHSIDIYLCDKCGIDFTTLEEVQRHEILCCENRAVSDSPVISEEEAIPKQNSFLNYFQLRNVAQPRLDSPFKKFSKNKKSYRNPLRFTGIPVSSPLGSQIHCKFSLPSAVIVGKMEKMERYCSTLSLNLHRLAGMNRNSRDDWRVSWKPTKTGDKLWTHEFRYPLQQWWRMPKLRKIQMKTQDMSKRVQRLCKPLQIKLRRLTGKEIEVYNKIRTATPVLKRLTSEEVQFYTKPCNVSPSLRRLSVQEIEAYTNPCIIAPIVRRLSFQEIEKFNQVSSLTDSIGPSSADCIFPSANGNYGSSTNVFFNIRKHRDAKGDV